MGFFGLSSDGGRLQRPVPCHSRFQRRIVGGIEPDLAAAPAKTGDAEFRGISLTRAFRPCHGCVEIGGNLFVGNLGDDLRNDLLRIGHARDVAFARKQQRRDCEVALLGESAADVLDMFVDAEDFVHDEDGWERTAARGHCAIRGNFAAWDWNPDLAGDESVAVGCDRVGRHRHHSQREAGCETSDHERATRNLIVHISNFCKTVSWNARVFRA